MVATDAFHCTVSRNEANDDTPTYWNKYAEIFTHTDSHI